MTTTAPVERASNPTSVLTDEMLARFDERAPIYDRHNQFFDEDFAELRASGFLDIAIPTEFGGGGARLDEYSQLLRRLSYCAPATALAVNMHVYWTGVAADLLRAGDESCRFILDRAAAGEVFCALHGEPGNDMPLVLSTSTAARTDGGWLISGHKFFGSLTPVWTLGGFHAMDVSDPAAPQIVHGFVPRSTSGVEIVDTWDTLGMRATQSQDTVLHDGVRSRRAGRSRVPDRVRRRQSVPRIALRLGLARIRLGLSRCGAAGVRHDARAAAAADVHRPDELDGPPPGGPAQRLRDAHGRTTPPKHCSTARPPTGPTGADHADWPVRLISARQTVINNAYDIVDRALDLSGGAGAFKRNRIEQLFRDVRMGRFHPGNTLLAHELIAKLCLGIDPDATQRWG